MDQKNPQKPRILVTWGKAMILWLEQQDQYLEDFVFNLQLMNKREYNWDVADSKQMVYFSGPLY